MEKEDFIKWARKLEETYVSSDRVREELAHVELIAVVGPTGVGKTTIINELKIPNVLTDFTRPIRGGEKNGRDGYFRDDYIQMLQEIKSGEYVQFLVNTSEEFYGTRRKSYPDQGQCAMAVLAEQIQHFEQLGFHKVRQFYVMPPGYVEWMRRVGTHQSADLQRRLEEAKRSMKLALRDEEYVFILNDNLDQAVQTIRDVLEGKEIDPHRQQLAKDTAGSLLEKLGDGEDDLLEGL